MLITNGQDDNTAGFNDEEEDVVYCQSCGEPVDYTGGKYCEFCVEVAEGEDDGPYQVRLVLTDAADNEIEIEYAEYDDLDDARAAFDESAEYVHYNDITDQNDESVVPSTTIPNQTQENNTTMNVNKQKAAFTPVTITFNDESELHDVIAAVAAYGRKTTSVSSSSIAADLKLSAYSGNARKTANRLLPQLTAAI